MTTGPDWSGIVGDTWAAEWRRTDRSFAGLAPHLDAAILTHAPAHGRILDIGCGAGATILALARARPDLDFTGVDLSATLVATARERAGALRATFVVGAVERVAADLAPIDLFVSRHGVMFFDDPVAALTALHAAARPGARLVFSCFRAASENAWATEIATAVRGGPSPAPTGYAPGPFGFADPTFTAATLRRAGWTPDAPAAIDFTYRAGEGDDPVADALDFFGRIGPAAPLLRAASPEERAPMLARLNKVLAGRATATAVDFPAATWLWSARA